MSDKKTSRRGLFGALRRAATGEATPDKATAAPRAKASAPVAPKAKRLDAAPEGKHWLGLRDIKPRGDTDVPQMAMPAERALSAEMKRVGERPPPWIPGCDDEGKA